MRDFFKPWRRKIGVVTLGLACVFAGGLVRSLSVRDTVSFYITKDRPVFVVSEYSYIYWANTPHPDPRFLPGIPDWEAETLLEPNGFYNGFYNGLLRGEKLQWRLCGFCAFNPPKVPVPIWFFSWWSFVIPLTLLSAWLLLVKPRPTAPKTTEPTPTTGT